MLLQDLGNHIILRIDIVKMLHSLLLLKLEHLNLLHSLVEL
jgi:hypothetical protein